jgi:hypothetical protein
VNYGNRILLMLILGAVAVGYWVRYGQRGVYLRIVNKTGNGMHDVRVSNVAQMAHRQLLDASEEWDVRLSAGDVESDVKLTFVDFGGQPCSALIGVQMRGDKRVSYAALVYSCGFTDTAEESRE